METSQIIELMKAMSENGLTDFSYEENGVSLKFKKHPAQKFVTAVPEGMTAAVGNLPTAAVEQESAAPAVDGQEVKSPLIGTFYAASSPDSAPFVQVGDKVSKGQVLGIIEAMKLMNEIESEYDGTVKQILIKNGDLVEYDQPMFVIG